MIKKISLSLLVAVLFLTSYISTASAAPVSFDLKKTSNTYNAFGTVSIDRVNNTYTFSAVVKDLPTALPNGGIYYLLWGLTAEGKADNLGPITNNSESKGNLNGRVAQFFITSEKERYPEFVSGPKIVQTDSIPAKTFTTTLGAVKPTARATGSPLASGSSVPVGGPTGAPETGLGGATLFNGLLAGLFIIGISGLIVSVKNRYSH
ncbi:MAG: hypothetical protein M3Q44_02095 [bacterium]|nr:hypothetical protein [bacterium]